MKARFLILPVVAALALLLQAGCAANRSARGWQPGEQIICPHCGRQFAIPEKLGE